MTTLFDGTLFADYHQFYLTDVDHIELPDEYTKVRSGLVVGDHGIVVFTARNRILPVRLELHDAEPRIDPGQADHVVIASFRTDGEILIADLMDDPADAARATVPSGTLRALVVSTGLGTLSRDGLEGEDRYVVHLWPGEPTAKTVLRQWEGG